MRDWSADPDTGIPSPELVAAWLELDTLPTERVPLWAAHWLTAGYDGVTLAEPLFQSSITNLPLGALYLLEDEWGAGWGRTEAQLCDAVREACLSQLERPRHKPTRPG